MIEAGTWCIVLAGYAEWYSKFTERPAIEAMIETGDIGKVKYSTDGGYMVAIVCQEKPEPRFVVHGVVPEYLLMPLDEIK